MRSTNPVRTTHTTRPARAIPHPPASSTRTITTPSPAAGVTHMSANEDPSYPYFFFYGHAASNPLGVLSQWSDTSFTDPDLGVTFATAEHYMMYHKAMLFEPGAADAILTAEGPGEAKRLGRAVGGFDDKIWNAQADAIVEQGNYLKFKQNPAAWAVLRATRGAGTFAKTCVEASPRDKIWGIGFGASNAQGNEARWGANRLGKALTRVRDRLDDET